MKRDNFSYDVIVLGAGASGLMCAITAANHGRKVLVLEKANKPGKKILMSGGGRCNFTNYSIEAENFISNNPHFCKSALKRYSQWDFISLVERYSIEYEERAHGQLFCKESASEILNMLLDECESAGVEIRTRCEISSVIALAADDSSVKCGDGNRKDRYQLGFMQEDSAKQIASHSLVVATGALSIPTLGGSAMGYQLATQFFVPLIERRAGLVPFMFSDNMKPVCERLSGLALAVEVTCNKQSFKENLLFTHRGMSGPAILQISNYWNPGNEISIDLLPGMDACEWLRLSKQQAGKQLLKTLLAEKLAKSLVNELQVLWWPESASRPLAEYTDRELVAIGKNINQWRLKPSGTEGYRTAEVTLGGVDTSAISSKTMECKNQAGLYFIGEVVDVSGHLGGYNFQWAWSSGYSAGLFA